MELSFNLEGFDTLLEKYSDGKINKLLLKTLKEQEVQKAVSDAKIKMITAQEEIDKALITKDVDVVRAILAYETAARTYEFTLEVQKKVFPNGSGAGSASSTS